MASRKLPPVDRIPETPSSWMDLLAATTLEDASAATMRVDVSGHAPEGEQLRLIVQAFDESSSRLVGSTQRAVTARELREGVRVSVVEVHQRGSVPGQRTVVAWVEIGQPDLDALTARPLRGSASGTARGRDARVALRLPRRAA